MTREEFKRLADAMKAAYPRYNLFGDKNSLSVWYEMLKDIDYPICSDALKQHLQSSVYPPTIADLRNNSTAISVPAWSEAWSEVMRSITMYGSYREAEAMRSLSPLTRKAVRGIGYKSICMSENPDVVRGQFRSAYEAFAKEAAADAKLQRSLIERRNQQRIAMTSAADDTAKLVSAVFEE